MKGEELAEEHKKSGYKTLALPIKWLFSSSK